MESHIELLCKFWLSVTGEPLTVAVEETSTTGFVFTIPAVGVTRPFYDETKVYAKVERKPTHLHVELSGMMRTPNNGASIHRCYWSSKDEGATWVRS